MTEDEAKTKWCPHVRVPRVAGSTSNRDSDGDFLQEHLCVASQCMAWRLATKAGERGGYCGLAGAA